MQHYTYIQYFGPWMYYGKGSGNRHTNIHSDIHNTKYGRAFKKYGFTGSVIVEYHETSAAAYIQEEELVILAKSLGQKILNIAPGGRGGLSNKGKKQKPSHVRNRAKSMIGNKNSLGKKFPPRTKEHTENSSKAHKGQIPWNKNKKGLQSSPLKGKKIITWRSDTTVHKWFHPVYGEKTLTKKELVIEMLPLQKISVKALKHVVSGWYKSHKGWEYRGRV